MNRQPGYYWVKCEGEWIAALWHPQHNQFVWVEIGHGIVFDKIPDEINETRIPSPDEEIDLRDDIYIPDQYEEAFKKRIRSIADHCEFGLEFKNEVNGKHFDVDTDLLDKI